MLTVKQIEAAKPKEKPYRLLDGNGLYLYVPVSGKKVWQLRYKIDGKEKILTVGKYPLMTLQEARDKAWTARKDISVGIDPVKAKKASSNNNSFSRAKHFTIIIFRLRDMEISTTTGKSLRLYC